MEKREQEKSNIGEEGEVTGEEVGDTGFRYVCIYSKSKTCSMLSSSSASLPTPSNQATHTLILSLKSGVLLHFQTPVIYDLKVISKS